MNYHIIVNLNSNRRIQGTLKMYNSNGALIFDPVPCLGRSEYNTPATQINGNTPTGVYNASVIAAKPTTSDNLYSYGPNKIVAMDPTSGEALIAEQNGRTGLWIHGGQSTNGLRPTHGCVRLTDSNQAALIRAIASAGGGTGQVTISES